MKGRTTNTIGVAVLWRRYATYRKQAWRKTMTDYFLDYNGQVSQAGTLVDTGTTTLTNLHLTGTLAVDGATVLAAASGTTFSAGLTGSLSANRYVGATASVAPTTGAHVAGDWVVSLTGHIYVCTVNGTPGTWVDVGSVGNQVTSVFTRSGAVTATSGDYTVGQVTGAAPLASPTFTGTVTVPNGAGATDAAAFGQLPSVAGMTKVKGPYAFAYNTASINTGLALFTPAIGDMILDFVVVVDTAFNGTTPKADVGTFNGGNSGLMGIMTSTRVDLTVADAAISNNAGLLGNVSISAPSSLSDAATSVGIANAFDPPRWQLLVTAANPLLIVVSQTGQKSGTAVGGSAGAGRVYVVVATPSTS